MGTTVRPVRVFLCPRPSGARDATRIVFRSGILCGTLKIEALTDKLDPAYRQICRETTEKMQCRIFGCFVGFFRVFSGVMCEIHIHFCF